MKTLYLATPPQLLDDLLKGEAGLRGPVMERGEILGILRKAPPEGLIDQFGERPVCLRGLDSQGPVDRRIERKGGAL